MSNNYFADIKEKRKDKDEMRSFVVDEVHKLMLTLSHSNNQFLPDVQLSTYCAIECMLTIVNEIHLEVGQDYPSPELRKVMILMRNHYFNIFKAFSESALNE